MLDNTSSLLHFLPEGVLTLGIVVLLLWDLILGGVRRGGAGTVAVITVLASAASVWLTSDGDSHVLFFGLIARDPFTDFFKYFFAAVALVVGVVALRARDAIDYTEGRDPDAAEFYALILTLTLGMNLMAAATDLLTLYVSLELVSVMSYILSGFKKGERRSAEASLKYVIYGGVASGVMLYGLSLLFGIAGATSLEAVRAAGGQVSGTGSLALFLGVTLTMAGLGYKIASVPFHMWCPDVYEGAPTPVTAFLSVGPKAAGFALLIRFFVGAVPGEDVASGTPWPLLLGVLSVATMTLGNLSALGQTNLKRLLAYSSIAHAGYVLMGFSVLSPSGYEAMLLYLVTYLFMNLGAFFVVIAMEEAGVGEDISGYRGLGYRAPVPAALMALFLFSLTGIPPLAGFIGKFYLFAAVIARGGTFFLILAIIGIINSAISLFYYARVIKAMFLEAAPETSSAVVVSPLHGVALAVMAVPTVAIGLYWAPIVRAVDASLRFWQG